MPKSSHEPYRDPHRWMVFSVISVVYFFVYFHRVSTSVIVTDLLKAFDTHATALGLMSSMYFYIYALEQPLVGYLTDRWGPVRVVGVWSFVADCYHLSRSLWNSSNPSGPLGNALSHVLSGHRTHLCQQAEYADTHGFHYWITLDRLAFRKAFMAQNNNPADYYKHLFHIVDRNNLLPRPTWCCGSINHALGDGYCCRWIHQCFLGGYPGNNPG